MDSQQAAKYKETETHFKQALQLHHTVEVSRCTLRGALARAAVDKLADKAAPEGLYPTLVDLGQLYGLMSRCKDDDELQVHQEALDEVRGDIAHASMPKLQMHLSRILSDIGCTSVNMVVKLPMGLMETRATAQLLKLYLRRRSASTVPTRKMGWQHTH